jgi:undecaprenyl-diphosphatase
VTDVGPGPTPGPTNHRPEDLVRAVLGAGVLLATGAVAGRGVGPTERRAFAAVNRLPAWVEPLLWAPMQLGSLWGPFLVGGAVWWRDRRWRPAAGAVVVGVVAWQLAKVVKAVVDRGRPLDEIDDVLRRWGTPRDGRGFVSGHTAVATSVATVVSPYVSRRLRWALYASGLLVATGRTHVAAHLPLDLAGGAGLGALVGAIWNLAVGVEAGELA